MVLFNNITCALSGPDTLYHSSTISLPEHAKKTIQLTFLIKDLSPEHNSLDVYLKLTRENEGPRDSRVLEKKTTVTLFDDSKETTLEFNKKSYLAITFGNGKINSNPVPLFKRKIENFDAIEIMFDLENKFTDTITNATLIWIIDSQIKRPKMSASQIMQLSIQIFAFISLLLSKPSSYPSVFTLVLILLGIASINPLILFIPDVETIRLHTPILSSSFICVFRIFVLIDLFPIPLLERRLQERPLWA